MTKIKVSKCGRTRCCPYRVLLSHFVVTGVCVTEPVRKCNHMLLIVSSLTLKVGKKNGFGCTEVPPGYEPISKKLVNLFVVWTRSSFRWQGKTV